jgi:hypothetical protein
MDLAQLEAAQNRLDALDAELMQRIRVSVAYLPEVYQLRLHAHFVAGELEARKLRLQQPAG